MKLHDFTCIEVTNFYDMLEHLHKSPYGFYINSLKTLLMTPYGKCCLRKMLTNNHIVIHTITLRIAMITESFLAFEITIIVKFCELSLCQDLCA